MELADGVENLGAHEPKTHAFAKDIGEIELGSAGSGAGAGAGGAKTGDGAGSVSSASTTGSVRSRGFNSLFGDREQAGDGNGGGVEGGRHPIVVRLAWVVNPARWMNPTPVEARLLSYISIAVSLLAFAIGAGLATSSESSSMLAFALEALVDVVSSIVVIWRFHGSTTQDEKMKAREIRASVGIGLSFLLSGFVVLVDAIVHLASREAIAEVGALLGLSIPSWILLLSIGLLKLYISNKLESDALFEDGICSIGSSTISMSIWVSIAIHNSNARIWYLDGVVALVIGLGFIAYGVVIVRGHRFWTANFWVGSDKAATEGLQNGISSQAPRAPSTSPPSPSPPPSFGDSYTMQAANV